MSKVQNRTWNNSESVIRAKNRYSNKDFTEKNRALIKKANSFFNLSDFLKSYKILIGPIINSDGWAKNIKCPFRDHNDNTPSFRYNYKKDIFHCFVCGGGGSVEFLSKMEGKSIYETAMFLLSSINIDPYLNDVDFIDDGEQIEEAIMSFSLFVSDKVQKFKNNKIIIECIDKILYALDLFIENIIKYDIPVDDIKSRLDMEKERISELIKE